MPSSDQPRALVAYGPLSAGQWKLEAVVPREIKDNEVLVNIVASGVCLADVHFGDVPENPSSDNKAIWYPRVLGHEGRAPFFLYYTLD
jgi:D-arabinose 1-dehydrogenase-like Zn-dependent alcohol dehydrogenase